MYDTDPTQDVLDEVQLERESQDAKWGQQEHDDPLWATILGEEYGEACQAALKRMFGKQTGQNLERQTHHLREELIQVAAVAVAWVERIDRAQA